jgi:hypothetical protein
MSDEPDNRRSPAQIAQRLAREVTELTAERDALRAVVDLFGEWHRTEDDLSSWSALMAAYSQLPHPALRVTEPISPTGRGITPLPDNSPSPVEGGES